MAIVRDASSPAEFTLNSGTATHNETGTSAAFSPPANTYITVTACYNSATSSTFTPAGGDVTNTGTALSWAVRGSKVNASGGTVVIYGAWNANAQSGITVSILAVGASALGVVSTNDAGAYVDVWTGSQSDQTHAHAAGTSTSTSSPTTASMTTSIAGSQCIAGYIDFDATATPTTTDSGTGYIVSGQTSGIRTFKASNNGAPGTVNSSISETTPIVACWVMIEIAPLATVSSAGTSANYLGGRPGVKTGTPFSRLRSPLSTIIPVFAQAASQPPEDSWDWDSDDIDEQDATVLMVYDSAPVGFAQPDLPVQEDWFVEDGSDYEEPTLDTFEWSNPINPNAPPLPVDDFLGCDLDDNGDDWDLDDYFSTVGDNQPAPPVEDNQGTDLDDLGDDWDLDDYLTAPVASPPPATTIPILDDAWDWAGDDWPTDASTDSYQQSEHFPVLPYSHEWEWDEEAPPDYSIDSYSQTDAAVPGSPLLCYDDAWDWDSEQTQPEYSVDGYQQSDSAVTPGSPLSPYDDDAALADEDLDDDFFDHFSNVDAPAALSEDVWDWDSDWTQPDYSVDSYITIDAVVIPGSPLLAYDDAWDWSSDWTQPDYSVDSYSQLDGPGLPTLPGLQSQDDALEFDVDLDDDFFDHFGNVDALQPIYDDAWDWQAEASFDDDWECTSDSAPVGPNGPPIVTGQVFEDPPDLFDDDVDDDLVDHFTGYDQLQPILDDAWDWDAEQSFDDDWEATCDSAPVGPNAPPVGPPPALEDPQGFEQDDGFDDWEAFTGDSQPVGPNLVTLPANGAEDAWDWSDPDNDSGDAWEDTVSDSQPVGPNAPPASSVQHYRRRMHRRS